MIEIKQVLHNKKDFMDLLLLADEQESMVMKYLQQGDMFVLYDYDRVCAVCVVIHEREGVCELKNIAVSPEMQHKGYGRRLVYFIENRYKDKYLKLIVGTGDSPLTIPFYEKLGFIKSYTVKNFFADNYDHPIFEAGVQLRDMIYLEKRLNK